LGSAITYGRRYSLSAILGIAQEDDDAEGAMKREKKKATPKPKPQTTDADNPDGLITPAQLKKISTMMTKGKLDNIKVKLILKVASKKELTQDRADRLIENWDGFVTLYNEREKENGQ
jgi:hypothetical protein